MRFRSAIVDGFEVFAVSGTNTMSFAIVASDNAKRGLLGFAVERSGADQPARWMPGFKVFKSIVPQPQPGRFVSTEEHPMQGLVWDDFTGKPGQDYIYRFFPVYGRPDRLDRRNPVSIRVRTEQLFGDAEHDVFFNRGVASSQAYARKFGNKQPKDLPEKEEKEALEWLTRSLDDSIFRFIGAARRGDTLLGCFYEFRYAPVLEAFKQAIDRGVNVRLIVDGKNNEFTDNKGKLNPSFPRTDNLKALKAVGIERAHVILRTSNRNNIQHNKFMVLLKGKAQTPAEVYTGSTNISLGGITGQTNVGHWVKRADVAAQFKTYWDLLATDPGAADGDERADATKKRTALRKAVAALGKAPATMNAIAPGVTTVFSPRAGLDVLELYVKLLDSAKSSSCVTLAFGVNELFKQHLLDNTPKSHLVFMLLEKKDQANARSTKPFVAINAQQNVYKAWGSFLKDPVYQWTKETNNRYLQFNSHVSYVHSKFLLMDPLGDDPIVVTGSANFSKASTNDNDENMLIIRGNRRVADIYFTEFNRLFNHYYFRAVVESRSRFERSGEAASKLFLDETDGWLRNYAPDKLRGKRVEMYQRMGGFTKL